MNAGFGAGKSRSVLCAGDDVEWVGHEFVQCHQTLTGIEERLVAGSHDDVDGIDR